ncbi:MAG: ribosomal RNA small subunit methyltransferase A [Deltaproteobacteria bacterium]|nr:ribosomal RNA small subunit methyltransferase A [Deltaproteobacteria bacterium]
MSHPKQILLGLEARARKSLSQNFLLSPHWADQLASYAVNVSGVQEIWEIGPGLGALTQSLCSKATVPIRIFEYDRKLVPYLKNEFPTVTVVEGDFLKTDLAAVSSAENISVLSNLPYHISSAVFFKLLEIRHRILRMVLTFQKEFAERLLAPPGRHAYGALSVSAQLAFQIQSLGVLPPGAFYPPPAVSSEALLLEPKRVMPVPLEKVTAIAKAAFKHRRKKAINNLAAAFPKINFGDAFARLGISVNARAEEIPKESYVQLARLNG